MAHHQKTENPVSPSVAIEVTSKGVTAYFDGEISIKTFEKPLDFKNEKNFKALGQQLKDMTILNKIRERKDTYWTVGIPDNASQDARKLVIDTVEDFRLQPIKSPNSDLAYIDDVSDSKKATSKSPQKSRPIRLINRSTAGAISYLQSLRDHERLNCENEGDVQPYLPHRRFLVMFVDNYYVYGAEFKTIDGLVQHKRSYSFKKDVFENSIQSLENAEDEESRLRALKGLWTTIVTDGIKPKNKNKFPKMPVVFTYNNISYIIKNSDLAPILPDFVYTPPDKFSLFPSINNKPQQWPDPNKFILKGINVKTRMLAGDADMIDYDVPSGFIGEATIGVSETFKASLIRDGEKLPIHRTIFEAKKPVEFYINFEPYGLFHGTEPTYVCNVDENGIIDCSKLKMMDETGADTI